MGASCQFTPAVHAGDSAVTEGSGAIATLTAGEVACRDEIERELELPRLGR
jgi:hypothetical protein